MTANLLFEKTNKPAFLIGGAVLVILGVYIASSKSMSLYKSGNETEGVNVSTGWRVAIGLILLIIGSLIALNGTRSAESAA